MAPTSRAPWLRGVLLTALVVAAGALGGGALVRAQPNADVAPQAVTPPRTPQASPPAIALPPPDAAADASDNDDQPAATGQPVAAAPPKPTGPLPRPKFAVAILQALDKVTAETERFEVPVGTPVRYKTLIFIVKACETTASDEDQVDAAAHVEVISQPKAPDGGQAPPAREVFKGWMYANSPGVNLLQHPIYDAWLIACKTEIPSA